MSDPGSVALKKVRDTLEEQRGDLNGKEATLRDRASMIQSKAGDSPGAAKLLAEAESLKTKAAPLATQIAKLDTTLQNRGEIFEQEAEKNLAPWLLLPGEQIKQATWMTGTIFEYATPNRVSTPKLERTLEDLRRHQPEVIDLRPMKTASGYGVAVSVIGNLPLGKIQDLSRALALAAARPLPGVFSTAQNPIAQRQANCLEMDLFTVEEPLVNHLSPIARAVNAVVELFAIPAGPERRISAIGRSLREPGLTDHVGVRSLNGSNEADHAIRVSAIFESQSAVTNVSSAMTDAIGQRLAELLGNNADLTQLASARTFYDRIVTASLEQRITIASPILKAGFAPMKYDYMSAYLWLLMLGLFGLGITIMFLRWERRGLVRKRGKEEVEAA